MGEEEKVLTAYDVSMRVLTDLHQRYFNTEDPVEKAKLCNQILATMDRISKMDETYIAQSKNELDNQTKLEMNKLDNETKLKICELETKNRKEIEDLHRLAEDGKLAVQGCTTLADIGCKALITIGGIALTGAAMNMECDGYTAGKSLAYKLATDIARKVKL